MNILHKEVGNWLILARILTFIAFLAFIGAFLSSIQLYSELSAINANYAKQPQRIAKIEQLDETSCSLKDVDCPNEGITKIIKVTGFSSIECGTVWCRTNAGKPRGQQIALNAKFGKYSAVYIPKFNKTYKVIGTTDHKTESDIWFGDDQQAALNHGTQYLEVKLIK